MRAWLLFLAVLATFLTIVQVASTEDISTRFIESIKPIEQTNTNTITKTKTKAKTTTTALTQVSTTTALQKAFNPIFDLTTTTSTTSSSSKLSYKNSSDKNKSRDTVTDTDNTTKVLQSEFNNKINEIDLLKNIKKANNLNNEVFKVQSASVVQQQQSKSKNKHNQNHHNKNKNSMKPKSKQNQIMAVVATETNQEEQHQQQQHRRQNHQHKQHPHKHHNHHAKQHRHPHQHHQDVGAHTILEETTTTTPTTTTTSSATSVDDAPIASEINLVHGESYDDIDDDIEIVAAVEVPANVDAIIEEDEPSTYSNKEIIKDKVKPDPSTLVEIENSLLSLFNMKRPPKIDRSKIIIPEAMKQLYAQIMGHELDSVNIPRPGLLTKSANTVRSFTHKDSKIDDRFPHHHRFRLHFDVKSIPSEEKLKAAELQLTREAIGQAMLQPRQANRTRYQVLVYDITRVGVRGKREPNYLLLDTKTIRLNSTETISMDVQPAVDRWLATPQKNYGLLVEVRTMRSLKPAPHHHVRLRRSADEPHEKWQHKQPLLFTYTDDGRHKARSIRDVSNRSKRHRRPYRRKNNEEICRRHSLYVDFADVGWSDWIVAPPGYDAFYCHGKCPFPLADHLNSTNHAVVQTLVNNLNPGKVPKACCVPTQLEGISMLYLNDQSTVVLKNYQDMTVVGCGCR